MKKLMACLVGIAMTAGFSAGFADELPQESSQMAKIVQKLQDSGYVAVHKIEKKKDVYEAEVINIQGNEMEIRMNPETGETVSPKNVTMPRLTLGDALKKVEAAGYSNVSKIESEKNQYEVKATDNNGKTVKLKVDAVSGEIKKD